MYTSLATLLLLATSAALSAPTSLLARQQDATTQADGADPSTCLERSQDMTKWTVEQFDFHSSYIFTTPSHQNSWGYVNFTLSNPALDYKPTCSAQSNQLSDFFYGTVLYECTMPEEALSRRSVSQEAAAFTFSRPSGELEVAQSWYCPEEGARFVAEGGVKLNLNCKDREWQNPDWEMGQIYSSRTVTCDLVDAEAPVTEIGASAPQPPEGN